MTKKSQNSVNGVIIFNVEELRCIVGRDFPSSVKPAKSPPQGLTGRLPPERRAVPG